MFTQELTRLPGRPYGGTKPGRTRYLTAMLLHGTSQLMAQLAHQLMKVRRHAPRAEPVYEFYAEAGAPEGALYIDGQLVGHVPGVRRL